MKNLFGEIQAGEQNNRQHNAMVRYVFSPKHTVLTINNKARLRNRLDIVCNCSLARFGEIIESFNRLL